VVLDNEVVVLAKETNATPAVTINLAIRTGSICDPADAHGLTYLLSRVIDRGTATQSADEIAEELDSRGTALTTIVTRHLFFVACTCLSSDFERILALVGAVVMAPSLPESEIATRMGEVITSIRQDHDNPAVRAHEALMTLLYPADHPYGWRTKGTIETVEAVTRDHLVRQHAERFAPSLLTAVIVGDVAVSAAVDAAARVFGAWRARTPAAPILPPVTPLSRRQRLVVPMMNKAQADIAYGFTTIRRADPDYYAYWIMNNALGQYAIGGRLGDSIRERQGMAYYVGSTLDANVAEGPLVVRAGVNPANVDRAVASIDQEIGRLASEGLTDKELFDCRRYLIGAMPRALETNAGIANFLQTVEFFGLGLDYDVKVPSLLNRVTLDEVNTAARRALDPDRASVVIAGPYDDAQKTGS
jgi:zinc protease